MDRTPEEIKADLTCWGTDVRIDVGNGEYVPYDPKHLMNPCSSAGVCRDALAYIEQLEAKLSCSKVVTQDVSQMSDYLTMYLPVRFPVDQVNCNSCFLCQQDPHNRNRLVCLARPQTITNPADMGWMCPLLREKEGKPDGCI